MRALNPGHAGARVAPLRALRQLERDPGIFRKMVLGDVAAPVEIEGERGGALLEWLAEQIDSADDQRKGIRNSLAAPALRAWLGGVHFWHRFPQRFTAREKHSSERGSRAGKT